MPATVLSPVIAAIDVGTNAVRLELARVLPDGSLETLHQERDPVRPGEGVFKTGAIPEEVADRLLSTLRRYAALCRRHRARVKAVATSAVREARNRDDIVRRTREEAGLTLEVVSGKEEARLICLGVLHRKSPSARSLLVDIGGGSTEVATAVGEHPTDLWSLQLGAVRLSELFDTTGVVSGKQLKVMRNYAAEVLNKQLPTKLRGVPKIALGSSGTINAVVGYAAKEGAGHATVRELAHAAEELCGMTPEERRKHFDPRRAEIIVAGAVILETVARHLGVEAVAAVDRGLRDGVLVDVLHRLDVTRVDHSLADAALVIGRRFYFDEKHHQQVAELALALFDQLTSLHQLPPSARPYLEVAALLHDIGNAVSFERHHKHTYYLIHNADIPGLADTERELVARIARYHRRSPPDVHHCGMTGMSATETRMVRKLATLLRVADSLDRSHHQPVRKLTARVGRESVSVHVKTRAPVDLELWNVERELENFRRVFGRKLVLHVGR
ncbi:MAG: Ppx/GppA family phosphatase [Myxococcaceae bacterium]|nr:Ppx/GppA family phosphatase [Myxococcaceae bacterium]